jgi:probable rRNA maturation factor
MIEREVNVIIDIEVDTSITEAWLVNIVHDIVEYLGTATSTELGLVITDSSKIKELNRIYRGIDEPTDVLAFTMKYDGTEGETPFIVPPDNVHHLGEVIISYPEAVKQALERDYEVKLELATLIVHGILHLHDYDHEKPEDGQLMEAKEREIIERLNIS